MRFSLILILVTVMLVGSVATIIVNDYYRQNAPETCEQALKINYIWLPDSVSDLFMDNHLILHFSMINGKLITIYGTVKDHGIYELSCNPTKSKYDAEVWMTDETAIYLATSTKPITTFVTNWRNGKITITTYNSDTEKKLSYADVLVANDYEPVPISIRMMFSNLIG